MNYLLNSKNITKYSCKKDKRNSIFLVLFFVVFLLFFLTKKCYSSDLPLYLLEFANKYSIPLYYVGNFSLAESSHNKNKISHKNAYGRFQITLVCLQHYCQIIRMDYTKIKDKKKYLLNDKNNCYIFCFMVNFWFRQGYSLLEIIQIWLFGETGYLSGRYSYSFEKKIIYYDN